MKRWWEEGIYIAAYNAENLRGLYILTDSEYHSKHSPLFSLYKIGENGAK
jgi:hypothetical protein